MATPQIGEAIGPQVSPDVRARLTEARENLWGLLGAEGTIDTLNAIGGYGHRVRDAVTDRSWAGLTPSVINGMEDPSDAAWLPRRDAAEALKMVWDDTEATRAIEFADRAIRGLHGMVLSVRMRRHAVERRRVEAEMEDLITAGIRHGWTDRAIAEQMNIDHTKVWRRRKQS